MLNGFFDFYRDVYIPDHAAPLNRWVHFLSNISAISCFILAILWESPLSLYMAVWFQLGPPYLGHIAFEKTHRSIDQSPIYAFMGSWWTTFEIFRGNQCITHGVHEPVDVPGPHPLLDLVRRHGRNLHSFMVLEPGLEVWTTPDGDAGVAYADRGGYWVAAGGPLCAPERLLEVSQAFAAAAAEAGRKVVFFGVGQRFVDRMNGDFDAFAVGQTPVWDPGAWTDCVATSRKLRNRLRRGQREGVEVRRGEAHEVAPHTPLRETITRLANRWAESRALPPMGFMVTLELFQHAELRRYFVAEHEGRVVAVAVCVPVCGRNGWLVEDMLMAPTAPAGTSEVLVDTVMRELAQEGAELVTLGMVALAGLEATDEPNPHPWLMELLRLSAGTMGGLYNFQGLYRFRRKLRPLDWEPVYVVAGGVLDGWTIRAVLMAFAEGWLPRFGLRVLGRWAHRRVRR